MSNLKKYPEDHQIKIKWTKLHIGILVISTVSFLSFFCFDLMDSFKFNKFFSVFGLYLDIIGVTMVSLRTPYFGTFYDGGKIEYNRAKAEEKYFQIGMFLIGLGFFLQALGAII